MDKYMNIDEDILEAARELRHGLHMHPELSNRERATKARLMGFLSERTELQIVDKGAWFYAVYRSGRNAPGIAFRADMDALPIMDMCDKEYASTVAGVGHKCGHDGHCATLCAFALYVDRYKPGRDVYFLFQHAEETGDGAKVCVSILDENNIGSIYGLHIAPGVPLGTVCVKKGLCYWASRGVELKFSGAPSHASMPETGRTAAYALARLTELVENELAFNKYGGGFATVIMLNCGARAFGTQAGGGELLVTVRGETEDIAEKIQARLIAEAEKLKNLYALEFDYTLTDVFPETVSDPDAAALVMRACAGAGLPVYEAQYPVRSSEDFGYYTRKVKGAFFGIGGGEAMPPLHTTALDFPDAALEPGVHAFAAILHAEETGRNKG